MKRILALCLMLVLLCGCGASSNASSQAWEQLSPIGQMELEYAQQFSVDYYEGGYSLVTIAGEDRFLLVPEGAGVPKGLGGDVTVLNLPEERIYLAASSAMDLFRELGALDRVTMTSTTAADWSLPEIQQAVENDEIRYVGKYSAPDYEMVLGEDCTLAIESTMIYHTPEVREQLERLGIPVLVERSSYESHPLGRMEWIKLYGLLTGHLEEAETFFSERLASLEGIAGSESTGKTAAFFYISSNGYANVRKSGDYISKMIEMAGGTYIFHDLQPEEDNALSTMNMELESFYAGAKDADILIYNSTIDGELDTLAQLLEKSSLLADFKAVKDGNVWCTEKNMFQQTTGAAEMITDLHRIVSGEADNESQLTFLHRLQ